MLQFFKPNPKKTGHACNWELTSSGDSAGVYLNLIKQSGWNTSTKTGSFKDGARAKVKFNRMEIGGMLDAIERNVECKLFHTSKAGTSQITFKPFVMGGEQKGFSIAVNLKKAGESKSTLFGIATTYGETRVLENFFENCLDRFFQADYAEKKKRFKESQK